jgi:hypothetical protein
MSLPVPLQSVVDEMDVVNEDGIAYINRRTGQLVTITDHDQEESTGALRAEDSPDFIALPSKFDVHESSIMERFCEFISDFRLREQLSVAIRGGGAFRQFKGVIQSSGPRSTRQQRRGSSLGRAGSSFIDRRQ